MAATNLHELFQLMLETAVEDEESAIPVFLQETDRETPPLHFILYSLTELNRDTLLGGGQSGYEWGKYIVACCSVNGSNAERISRLIVDYFNALAPGTVIDTFRIDTISAEEASDQDKPDIVSDKFIEYYSVSVNFGIGRSE